MMDTWYWRDVVALLDDAEEQDKQRFRDSENLAMLVDREDFSLNGEYVDRITDPNDPEVKADIARRKAAGIKPPPIPVLPPIGLRDPEVIEARRAYNTAVLETFNTPNTDSAYRRPGVRASADDFKAWERSRATTT